MSTLLFWTLTRWSCHWSIRTGRTWWRRWWRWVSRWRTRPEPAGISGMSTSWTRCWMRTNINISKIFRSIFTWCSTCTGQLTTPSQASMSSVSTTRRKLSSSTITFLWDVWVVSAHHILWTLAWLIFNIIARIASTLWRSRVPMISRVTVSKTRPFGKWKMLLWVGLVRRCRKWDSLAPALTDQCQQT